MAALAVRGYSGGADLHGQSSTAKPSARNAAAITDRHLLAVQRIRTTTSLTDAIFPHDIRPL